MKKMLALLVLLMLLGTLMPAAAEETCISGKAASVSQFGHVTLDISKDMFSNAGFSLGDVVTVRSGSFERSMPYLSSYYVDEGEYMIRGGSDDRDITLCINCGNFAEAAGMQCGDPVTLTLKEKAGALALEEDNSLVYSDQRDDFSSDEIFANFRPVINGILYRSASPADNSYNRALTADRLIQEAGIRTVLNMANTEEELANIMAAEDFRSVYYRNLYQTGSVILEGTGAQLVPLKSDEFAARLVEGFTFLADRETPFLVHCTEGKDRAGFAVMVLDMLGGFTVDEIIADYMISYRNYYGIEPGTEQYQRIAEKNILSEILSVAGLEKADDLSGIDLKAAAESYLITHGMSRGAVDRLEAKLTDSERISSAEVPDEAKAVQMDGGSNLQGKFRYIHDPREVPEAMKDIIENPDAVYGFSPDPLSARLGQFAEIDWTDPEVVAQKTEERRAYHESKESMMDILRRMWADGASIEEMARAVSAERNRLRLASYQNDPETLEIAKRSNLEVYGNEEGPTPEFLYEECGGSWITVLQKAFRMNMGMDACCGLFDEYYWLYIELGLVEDDAAVSR